MATTVSINEANGYTDYRQDHRFDLDHGTMVCPVASRTPGYKLIRLHGGVGTRIVKWQASRTGRPPIIPSAQDTLGDTLIHSVVSPSLPVPSEDLPGYDWTVRGEYTYVQRTPRVAGTDTIPTGGFPFPINTVDIAAAQMDSTGVSALVEATSESNLNQLYIEAIANGISADDLMVESYLWPFTSIPSILSNDLIITG